MELKLGSGKCSRRCLGSPLQELPIISWFEKTSSRSVGDQTSSRFESSESSIDRKLHSCCKIKSTLSELETDHATFRWNAARWSCYIECNGGDMGFIGSFVILQVRSQIIQLPLIKHV